MRFSVYVASETECWDGPDYTIRRQWDYETHACESLTCGFGQQHPAVSSCADAVEAQGIIHEFLGHAPLCKQRIDLSKRISLSLAGKESSLEKIRGRFPDILHVHLRYIGAKIVPGLHCLRANHHLAVSTSAELVPTSIGNSCMAQEQLYTRM